MRKRRLNLEGQDMFALTANEQSAARTLRFNNPNNEAFTLTFKVIRNLPPEEALIVILLALSTNVQASANPPPNYQQ